MQVVSNMLVLGLSDRFTAVCYLMLYNRVLYVLNVVFNACIKYILNKDRIIKI